MKNVCLIDLDDTLGDLKLPMMQALNRATGKDMHWSDWDTYDVPDLYDVTHERFLDILINEHVIESTVIHDSSYEFLNSLNDMDFHTVLITARGWHPKGTEITEKWITSHNLDVDELIVVDADQSKTDVINKFGTIEFSVDDRIKHCREYTQCGKVNSVILYDAPWNSHMTRWNEYWGGHDYDYRVDDLNTIISNLLEVADKGKIQNVC
jgi:5'(3')-deoxyribonucleotidase